MTHRWIEATDDEYLDRPDFPDRSFALDYGCRWAAAVIYDDRTDVPVFTQTEMTLAEAYVGGVVEAIADVFLRGLDDPGIDLALANLARWRLARTLLRDAVLVHEPAPVGGVT